MWWCDGGGGGGLYIYTYIDEQLCGGGGQWLRTLPQTHRYQTTRSASMPCATTRRQGRRGARRAPTYTSSRPLLLLLLFHHATLVLALERIRGRQAGRVKWRGWGGRDGLMDLVRRFVVR